MENLAAVVLAAGQSTRMKSGLTKVMHCLAGRPVIAYVLDAARAVGADPICVVSGREQGELNDFLAPEGVCVAYQRHPRGTADAVMAARRHLSGFDGYVLLLCGDIPLIRSEVISAFAHHVFDRKATVGVLTMILDDPGRYGRIMRDLDGRITRIVEAKDAVGHEEDIREVNTGVFCVRRDWLFRALGRIEPRNAQGEYYLTDIVAMSIAEGREVVGHIAPDAREFVGINTRTELAEAAERMRERINRAHQQAGVGIVDYRHTYIDAGVSIGMDTEIWPHSFLLGSTKVGSGCIIENGVVLKDAVIGDHVHVKSHTVIEQSTIGSASVLGPFSRVRPESKIDDNVRVGNFVEVKKSRLHAGVKANHLSYLGDADVGERTNIGCGTITCNYDGMAKHKTVIGPNVFVGSDTQFIAPVRIGTGATIGAGSTITRDVPANALAISRPEQVVVKHWRKKKR